jgi:hypothetical protein
MHFESGFEFHDIGILGRSIGANPRNSTDGRPLGLRSYFRGLE